MKVTHLLSLLLCLSFTLVLPAQDLSAYQKYTFSTDGAVLPYRILLPDNYNPEQAYPLILFLHGSGERGNDNELQLVHGAKLFLEADIRQRFPAIVVFPQCAAQKSWNNLKVETVDGKQQWFYPVKKEANTTLDLVEGLLKKLKKDYRLDKNRLYVGGLSMGGMGAFELVRRNPRKFAAAFPICGGAHPATAKKLRHIPWWIFHGEEDVVVDVRYSKEMATAIKHAGGEVKLSLYPDVNHDSWTNAFAEPELLSWLFAQKK